MSKEICSIKLKYCRKIKPIVIDSSIGNWIDLRCAEDIELSAGSFAVIPLGICVELPEDYEAIIAPRSSTYKKWGIIQVNSVGIIDSSYKGDNDEWGLPVIALWDTKIHKNDRICQFRILKRQPQIQFKIVQELGNADRNGFGSTGVN